MKVFIIIPCYNEAEHLLEVIKEVKEYGEVVVVIDGATDQSYQIAKNQNIKVLQHLVNRGQGAALETGNRYALSQEADIVIHFDADAQHTATEIPKLIQPIINGQVDIVLGSRFLKQENKTPFLKKWLILKPAIVFQNLMYGIKLTDTHNGFRALSRKALENIRITQDGMAHPTDITEQIISKNLRYTEVPVTIKYHEFGQGFLNGLKILRDLLFGKINK